ncbi:MAG: cytidine/deoxycytidylate deaminase family protein [Candidatus Omnitrophica bacterium]|nr:cytidine/deoxycytidylate deaminase family protein [Candidatus Omnitrophota bacterium]
MRPSWDNYFIEIVKAVAKRSTCDRGKVGCVLVKDKRILSTGYAGAPVGLPHCDEVGHEMAVVKNDNGTESQHCIRTCHAEVNAIAMAARMGVPVLGAIAYVTMTPCYACAKMLVNAGLVRVVAEQDYHASARTKKLFQQAGIKLEILDKSIKKYDGQKTNA